MKKSSFYSRLIPSTGWNSIWYSTSQKCLDKAVWAHVNEDKKCCYLTLPKCGCSTLFNVLRQRGFIHRGMFDREGLIDHGYTFFTVMRNPYTRVVSRYRELSKEINHLVSKYHRWKKIKHVLSVSQQYGENPSARHYNIRQMCIMKNCNDLECFKNYTFDDHLKLIQSYMDLHWYPQIDILTNVYGIQLDNIKISMLSDIELHTNNILTSCGLDSIKFQKRENSTFSGNPLAKYMEYYNDTQKKLVSLLYAKDIEYIKQSFPGFIFTC